MKIPSYYIKAALLYCQGRFPFLSIAEGTPSGTVLSATDGKSAIMIELGIDAGWLSTVATPTRIPVSMFEELDLSGEIELSEKDGTIYLVTEKAIVSEPEYQGKNYPEPYDKWFPPMTGELSGHMHTMSLSVLGRVVDTLRILQPKAPDFPVRFAQHGVKVEAYTGDKKVRMMILPLKP